MSARADVLLWAQRVLAKRTAPPHELLEIPATANAEKAQEAFHKIARMGHPDLHRNALSAQELEQVTQAYSIVAGAYQTFRNQAMTTTRIRPIKPEDAKKAPPVTPSGPAPVGNASGQMSSKALVYYRKAELSLRIGDLRAALLHLKMAIAADPNSLFLRTALAEVESEVRKG